MVGSSDASIAVLKVQYVGNGASDVYPFNRRVLNIGRADDNDVILEGLSISRHHMRVEFLGDQILVTDLGSINGVIIKGQIINIKQPTRVQFGEAIDLMEYRLVLQPGSSVDLRSISRRVKFIMPLGKTCNYLRKNR
jgi:pSer/pThr/pTyr-binding forkhead associated (FHA) protein